MASSGAAKNPKKANLVDHYSIKHLLDESVTEVVKSQGYAEDVRLSNVRLLIGSIIIAIALLAQFYPKKFPENRDFLVTCIGLYVVFNGLLQCISYTKEKNAFLFTYPPPGSFNSTGLIVSSKLPRFSDMYTLTIASADPKSISANKPVVLTKSVTKCDDHYRKELSSDICDYIRFPLIIHQLNAFFDVSSNTGDEEDPFWKVVRFTKDGLLAEGLFWKDVERLMDDYNGDRKNK